MLTQIALVFLVFLFLFKWLVIIDVLLSWAPAFGYRITVPFVRALIEPCYAFLSRHLPVSFGGLNFAPILLLLALGFAEAILRTSFPLASLTFPY
ncbi:MAG: YggT family protein [Patescibacteria group bacterium]